MITIQFHPAVLNEFSPDEFHQLVRWTVSKRSGILSEALMIKLVNMGYGKTVKPFPHSRVQYWIDDDTVIEHLITPDTTPEK